MEMKYPLIAAAIIIGSGIISLKNIDSFIADRENTIYLVNGKVRLGKVYEEHIQTNIEVIDKSNGSKLIDLSGKTEDIYSKSESYIKDQIDAINKNGGILDDDGKKTDLDFQTITWKSDVVVNINTAVTYRSEYANSFTSTIDSSEETIPAGSKTIYEVLQTLQPYSVKMIDKYEKNNSFIK